MSTSRCLHIRIQRVGANREKRENYSKRRGKKPFELAPFLIQGVTREGIRYHEYGRSRRAAESGDPFVPRSTEYTESTCRMERLR